MRADWRRAGDDLLTAIIIGPGGVLYRSVVELLPDGAGWDWTVWRRDAAPENSQYGKASDRAAAIAAVEDQLRNCTATEWLSRAKRDRHERAAPEKFERRLARLDSNGKTEMFTNADPLT